jgi:hypothetical protein
MQVMVRQADECNHIPMPILAGSIIGPIALVLGALAWYRAFEPNAFRDAQFVMIFSFFVPLGVVLGTVTGACAWLVSTKRRRVAGVCGLVGGGMVAIPFASFVGLFTEPVEGMRFLRESEWILPASWIVLLLVGSCIALIIGELQPRLLRSAGRAGQYHR